ncbi:RNase H domain-containing protein [Trichonephila clavipes]|nr:RNase H domain-containing protein [Trichonephila clavipes]
MNTIKRKNMDTIIGLLKPHLVTVYTYCSYFSECRVFLKYPDNATSKHKVSAGQIASHFTCELIVIRPTVDIYLTWTNIGNSDGILVLSDCRSGLEDIKEGKWGSPKKSIIFSSSLVHWEYYVPSSGSQPMLISKGTR